MSSNASSLQLELKVFTLQFTVIDYGDFESQIRDVRPRCK